MKLSEFDFDLPEQLIATRPARPRSSAKLLVAGPESILDQKVSDLSRYLLPGDRLVLNDTKVIPARLTGARIRNSKQGKVSARIEVTLLEPNAQGQWRALIKPLKKVNEGEVIHFSQQFQARLTSKHEGSALLQFNLSGDDLQNALAETGAMPLPPYIASKRAADEADKEDYQTIWAKNSGAVAAPTASLHFDDGVMQSLTERGVSFSYVTLHVGAGTFLPVKTDDVSDHKMHSEWGEVTAQAAAEMTKTRQNGGRVIPVGTTALRLIETAANPDGTIGQWQGDTDIFITPGYQFKIADALMTNFHLPKSTLMMLVSALMGRERIMQIYEHAISNEYRFFSYGDASLLLPGAQKRPG